MPHASLQDDRRDFSALRADVVVVKGAMRLNLAMCWGELMSVSPVCLSVVSSGSSIGELKEATVLQLPVGMPFSLE